ncbi:Glycine N-methyltransferase [Lamellibrachia satsuma]|nr:Glycine N-methyltransferase [Lamellibrachia satsuma]
MPDGVYQTRSLGVPADRLRDQYADGAVAMVYDLYIGCTDVKTSPYIQWLTPLLRERGCQNILDVACGTAVDSVMLLAEGFNVVSTDASDKMLKYALKERWRRRKEKAFDKWVIEEANWLSLSDDLSDVDGVPEGGFDAVVCLGNSFSHLPDLEGSLHYQKVALSNFRDMIKPGGILVIDHRNFDDILTTGKAPAKNIYNVSDCKKDIKVSNLYVNCRPTLTTFDYTIDIPKCNNGTREGIPKEGKYQFRLSFYPHRLAEFSNLLKGVFGEDCAHSIHGDSQTLGRVQKPAYYTHIAEKSAKHAST